MSVPEIFRYWLQGGRVDIGFLGAAQIDRFGNLNTTVIGGTYDSPRVRLPGAGGAPEIATSAKEVAIILKQSRKAFVEKLDFVTTSGYFDEPTGNRREPARGRGPTTVITDLGVMVSHPRTNELVQAMLHPGVTVQQVKDATGWNLKVAADLQTTPEPTPAELHALRDLHARTAAAHGSAANSE